MGSVRLAATLCGSLAAGAKHAKCIFDFESLFLNDVCKSIYYLYLFILCDDSFFFAELELSFDGV